MNWKIDAERQLMATDSPSVLTTAMLHSMATTGRLDSPSSATFTRWVAALTEFGKLDEVIRGVYLNRLGHRNVSPAAAANWIRARSVVSLSWVLEQGHITNNFGDTVTCVIPTENSWPNPNVGDRVTKAGTFRFFAMPRWLVDAGKLEDARDMRFDYPRATPEKAFLDWIFLGASPKSRMTRPPFDLDVESLQGKRLARLSKCMELTGPLDRWMRDFEAYQTDDEVRENASNRLRM